MRLIFISDTHELHDKMHHPIPDGDYIIHCGDATGRGSIPAITKFAKWFGSLPHKKKVFVAGNHDFCFENANQQLARNILRENGIIYLQDDSIELDNGMLLYGSPWQPWFYDWAFNLPRGKALEAKWKLIPDKTDILVCHSPPYNIGILDLLEDGDRVGCRDLTNRIKQLSQLKLFASGHIHSGYSKHEQDGMIYINASICDESYDPINLPIIVDI